ncbi:MAG: ribonuclease T [Steroidobacteraceae bacterium]|jgi:ribonuclease T|nr:ribonuclease T [Steroidobacteraceae bacterium]
MNQRASNPADPRTGTNSPMRERFRGFLPVVVDCETGGFNAQTDALLEIAGVLLELGEDGVLKRGATWRFHVQPFEGARMDPASLAINGIDPYHPLRPALPERDALGRLFKEVRTAVKDTGCTRAILVGHNAAFDLGFLNAAVARSGIKRNPFHPFSCFDTATLAGVAFGQTVLSRAVMASGMRWEADSAHSAVYDAERTADLFCEICNQFRPIYETSRARLAALGPLAPEPGNPLVDPAPEVEEG